MTRLLSTVFLALALASAAPVMLAQSVEAPASAGATPVTKTPEEDPLAALIALEERVAKLVPRLLDCTVGLRIDGGQGSGVIISEDGIILTAAHVFDDPGKPITVIMNDGRTLKGKTLGRQEEADFGVLELDGPGPFPFAEMGTTKDLEEGSIVLATGHPGGFRKERPPVFRLGQVTSLGGPFMGTSCVIDKGDSGGPLWDLDGKVVGIHSRIQLRPRSNFHITIDKYRAKWDRLVAGEEWGIRPNSNRARFGTGPIIGARVDDHPDGGARITRVHEGTPAAAAKLLKDDVIAGFDGEVVKDADHLISLIRRRKVGDKVALDVRRRVETKAEGDAKPTAVDSTLKVEIELGSRNRRR